MKRAAVKQDLGIYEIKPTRFQNGHAFGVGPLEVHPDPDVPTRVAIVKTG
jgi:hypothetical protein